MLRALHAACPHDDPGCDCAWFSPRWTISGGARFWRPFYCKRGSLRESTGVERAPWLVESAVASWLLGKHAFPIVTTVRGGNVCRRPRIAAVVRASLSDKADSIGGAVSARRFARRDRACDRPEAERCMGP